MAVFNSKNGVLIRAAIVLVCFYLSAQIYCSFSSESGWMKPKAECFRPMNNVSDGLIFLRLSDVAKSLHRARIHARGTKTAEELNDAIEIVDEILKSVGLYKESIVKRNIVEPKSVCGETFKGSQFGYPLFDKGFEATNCSHAKPLSELVTVVALIEAGDTEAIDRVTTKFADSLQEMTGVTAIIATKPNFKPKKPFPVNIKFLDIKPSKSDGYYWNRLVSQVNTPYALIARDVEVLTEDARLERLVREIEMLQVTVAGGAVRHPDGRWDKGCYQSVYRNYTLRYLHGYDESLHDCLFCDYIEGPFVTSVETLKFFPFDPMKMESGFFEDWFLQLNLRKVETVVCPDSMFHVRIQRGLVEKEELKWAAFMRKWDLYKVMLSTGPIVASHCSDMGYRKPYRALNPCRLVANAEAVKLVMQLCEEEKIMCEMTDGTLMGGVKLGKVLPWERDADLNLLLANHSTIEKFKGKLGAKGLKLTKKSDKKFIFFYKVWRIELWNAETLSSEIMQNAGKTPTQILSDGHWYIAPRNPGLYMRNRYGPEIYKHALHWSTTGANSSWEIYQPGKFQTCDKPGQHDCMDGYNGDGDLQFSDPLP